MSEPTVKKYAWRDEEYHPGCVVLRIFDRPWPEEHVLSEDRARAIYEDLRKLFEAGGRGPATPGLGRLGTTDPDAWDRRATPPDSENDQ